MTTTMKNDKVKKMHNFPPFMQISPFNTSVPSTWSSGLTTPRALKHFIEEIKVEAQSESQSKRKEQRKHKEREAET